MTVLMHEAWGGWPWLAPLWILFWIVVIVLAFRFFTKRGAWCGPRRATTHDPAAILAERFARGEIDAAEYRARLEVVGK